MKSLLGACFLWAVFSTGTSLTCNSCLGLLGPCPLPTPQNCLPGQDTCLSSTGFITLFGGFNFDIKACAPSSFCRPGNYSSTTALNTRGQILVTCCNDTNLCNSGTLTLPRSLVSNPNGNFCPSCFSLGTLDCPATTIVPCIGEETQCLNLAGSLNFSNTLLPATITGVLKGCVTPNLCLPPQPLAGGFDNNGITYDVVRLLCTNATSTPSLPSATLPSSTLPSKIRPRISHL